MSEPVSGSASAAGTNENTKTIAAQIQKALLAITACDRAADEQGAGVLGTYRLGDG